MGTYLGDTFRVKATLTDFDGSVLTPDSQSVKLYDPSGTEKDSEASPISEEGGVYRADLTIPSDASKGLWKVVWKATKGGQDKEEELELFVDETP